MDRIKFSSPSYGWMGIIPARPQIKKVGSRIFISVWNEPWIPSQSPMPAICKEMNYYPTFTVNHLIDPLAHMWNMELINAIIDPVDIPIIQSFPISSAFRPYSISWHFTKSRKYTVKSRYHLEKEGHRCGQTVPIYGPSFLSLQAHT